ncbi:glyoxalase/bleomycin resistance/extradiol dioxygenase family protein [Niabella sp. CC-SYL272]|uniref:VOC family protein n=1 Tax=Niabella agricola TaxID=2891571 RepID=UPI001F1DBA5F|nr:glyoxalase/bleomycin resistance/extradiol dioxygenase family protein [Niabella agricola]MCF3111425.1 glyoxalase/bleomycin resistance/extradiol dioxygenase family protein [Niabella agricola]
MMQAITPYLNFNGDAAAALDFYTQALGGQVVHRQTFGDTQADYPSPESHQDKIMHALFNAGELNFMVSDCPPGVSVTAGSNMSLALNFTDEETIVNTFNAMAAGGTITMPLQDTFWGAKFGMITDRFGISWMFNYDKPKD